MKATNAQYALKCKPLQKGDKVAIAATARKVVESEVANAALMLKAWGLEIVFAPFLFEQDNQYAGNDVIRIKSMQAVLNDPEIKAILCARGGYGTIRIIDNIDFEIFCNSPKWIIGYSDITVLHSHLLAKFKCPSIHSVMAFNMQPERADAESIESLRKILFDEPYFIEFPVDAMNLRSNNISGILTGGNLSVIYSLMGSKSEIDFTDKILFLEDLDEYLYHIDRMMQALKRAGKLSKLKALVVGDMSDMKDNAVAFGKSPNQIIAETVSEYSYPVLFGVPAGHERRNLAMVFGEEHELICNEKSILLKRI